MGYSFSGLSKTMVIEPFEIENGAGTRESYKNLLTRKLFPHLASLREDYIVQQNGAASFELPEYELV